MVKIKNLIFNKINIKGDQKMRLTVGEISKVLGISPETIRHYVNEEIITPKQDKDNSYWYYSSDDVLRITDILFYRSMGLTIKQIKMIMDNLPLHQISDVISIRRGELINEIKESLDQLYTLQQWDLQYKKEIDSIGEFSVGIMPTEYKYPGFIEDKEHLVDYLKEGFDLEREDWGDVSFSFYVNTVLDPIEIRRYLGVDKRVKLKLGEKIINHEEYKAEKSISTEVFDSDNILDLINPIISYATKNGYELTGEFYGHENTNYFIKNKRCALYRVYGIIK